MVFEDGGLEVLANPAIRQVRGGVQDGLGMIVLAGVGLGVAKRGDAAEAVEEVGKADVDAFDGDVRDLVAPGAEQVPGVGVGEVQLDALVDGATKTAAEVVPGEPALEGVLAAARGRLPVDDAALVVLGESAGGFFDDGGGGVAPAFHAAGLVEVSEEGRAECGAVGELAGDVYDVVVQWFEELGGGDLRRREAGFGSARGGWRGQDVDRKHEQGHDDKGSPRGRWCEGSQVADRPPPTIQGENQALAHWPETDARCPNRRSSFALVMLRLKVTGATQ